MDGGQKTDGRWTHQHETDENGGGSAVVGRTDDRRAVDRRKMDGGQMTDGQWDR